MNFDSLAWVDGALWVLHAKGWGQVVDCFRP